MYSQSTKSIMVSVVPEYEDDRSAPSEGYYVWSYRVNIANKSEQTVRLLNRHWIIVDEAGQVQEVRGTGVVGVQPLLKPGEEFEYSSTTHLNSSSGLMMGSYEMRTEDQDVIEVKIPAFSLDCPHTRKNVN